MQETLEFNGEKMSLAGSASQLCYQKGKKTKQNRITQYLYILVCSEMKLQLEDDKPTFPSDVLLILDGWMLPIFDI